MEVLRSHGGPLVRAIIIAALGIALANFQVCAGADGTSGGDAAGAGSEPKTTAAATKKSVGVLSAKEEPSPNSSQGLYIKILRDAGFEARAISAEEVREKKLAEVDIFIIGGGSGTAFNKSLGEDGCKMVKEFVQRGGGALASCAGGYSFANGTSEALKQLTIAQASIVDNQNGRWARGKAEVELTPADERYHPLKMYYANGPLWEISKEPGADQTVALARFKSDVKKEGDPGGVMPGTPAILAGTYGAGRFVLFSAHPEFHKSLGNYPLVPDAARWVTRGSLKAGESIGWAEVFPHSKLLESAAGKAALPTDEPGKP